MNKKRNRNRKSKRKFTATVSKPKNDIFSKWQGNTIPMLGYNYKIDKLKNDSKINTDVLYTQDYSKFKLMEDNRDVDDSHVAELVVSIRKRGQLQPIIIHAKFWAFQLCIL